jgi:hypothetical protein
VEQEVALMLVWEDKVQAIREQKLPCLLLLCSTLRHGLRRNDVAIG